MHTPALQQFNYSHIQINASAIHIHTPGWQWIIAVCECRRETCVAIGLCYHHSHYHHLNAQTSVPNPADTHVPNRCYIIPNLPAMIPAKEKYIAIHIKNAIIAKCDILVVHIDVDRTVRRCTCPAEERMQLWPANGIICISIRITRWLPDSKFAVLIPSKHIEITAIDIQTQIVIPSDGDVGDAAE